MSGRVGTVPARGGGGGDLFPRAVIAVAVLAAAVDGAVWLASRVVSVTAGAGWHGSPGSPGALLRAVQTRGAAGLGSTEVLVVAGALLAIVLALVAAVVVRRAGRSVRGLGRARWASRADLLPLAVDAAPAHRPGRIALGRVDPGGQQLAAEPRHSVCVLGPTGSGKTVSVVIPTLEDWTGPAVVTSVKPDVLDGLFAVKGD